MAQGDTTFLVADSSIVQVKRGNETILIVQNQTKEHKDDSINILVTFVIPIGIVIIGAVINYLFSRRKTNSEIAKIKSETRKTDSENKKLKVDLDKVKEETEQMKKSFQPIVVGTIQGVRDKLIDKKIKALEELADVFSQFKDPDEQVYGPDGEQILDINDYYDSMFKNYYPNKYERLEKYRNEYSYFFGKESYVLFQELFDSITKMNVTRDSYYREEIDFEPGETEVVKSIIEKFQELSESLRKELHLDNTYIEEFIAANQLNNPEA